jgi:hypothetical protein
MLLKDLTHHKESLVRFVENLIHTRGEYVLGESIEGYLEVFNPDFNLEESSLWFVLIGDIENLDLEFKVVGSTVYAFFKGEVEIQLYYAGDLVGSQVEELDFKIRVFNEFQDNPLEEAYLDTFTDTFERKRLTPVQKSELAEFLRDRKHTKKIFNKSFYDLAELCYKRARPKFKKGFRKPTFDPDFIFKVKYTGLKDLDVSFKTHNNSDYAVFDGEVSIEFRFNVDGRFFPNTYSTIANFRVKIHPHRNSNKILIDLQKQIRGFQ